MAVHDLDAHRRARKNRRWASRLVGVGVAALALLVLTLASIGLWVLARHPRPTQVAGSPAAPDVVAARLPEVASAGPAPCPFAARDGGTDEIDWSSPFVVGHRCVRAGSLLLTSGAVVAADPLVNADRPPFVARFPAGTRSEVWISISDDASTRDANAFAMLLVGDTRPVRFEEARERDGNAYGVDTGTGSFLDAEGARWIEAHLLSVPNLFDVMQSAGYFTARYVNLCIDPHTGANLVAFESGIGDGVYVTYAGYDASGTLVALITDFETVEMGVGVHPWLGIDPERVAPSAPP